MWEVPTCQFDLRKSRGCSGFLLQAIFSSLYHAPSSVYNAGALPTRCVVMLPYMARQGIVFYSPRHAVSVN